MHKLIEFVCDELEELERKAGKEGALSVAEVQYADMLANMKKNLLKSDELMEESDYSMASYNRGSYARGRNGRSNRGSYEGNYEGSYEGGPYEGSYARGRGRNARRDAMGRYSREGYSRDSEEMVEQLRDLMEDAPDEQTRKEFEKFIRKVEQM